MKKKSQLLKPVPRSRPAEMKRAVKVDPLEARKLKRLDQKLKQLDEQQLEERNESN